MEAKRLQTVLDNSVSYLRFENGALNTDTLGGLSWSTGGGTPLSAEGKYGGGVYLDTSAFITSPNSLGRSPFTNGWWVNAWVKGFTGAVFSCKQGSYENYVGCNSTTMYMHVQSSTDVGLDFGYTFVGPDGFDFTKYSMLTWATTSTGSKTVKFYINGNLIDTQLTGGYDPGLGEAECRIGSFYIEGKGGTNGYLDDLLLGANYIITDAEVKKLYQARGFPLGAII